MKRASGSNRRMFWTATGEDRYQTEASPTAVCETRASRNNASYSVRPEIPRLSSLLKKFGSLRWLMKMSGCVRNQDQRDVVPHFGPPTIKKLGFRIEDLPSFFADTTTTGTRSLSLNLSLPQPWDGQLHIAPYRGSKQRRAAELAERAELVSVPCKANPRALVCYGSFVPDKISYQNCVASPRFFALSPFWIPHRLVYKIGAPGR